MFLVRLHHDRRRFGMSIESFLNASTSVVHQLRRQAARIDSEDLMDLDGIDEVFTKPSERTEMPFTVRPGQHVNKYRFDLNGSFFVDLSLRQDTFLDQSSGELDIVCELGKIREVFLLDALLLQQDVKKSQRAGICDGVDDRSMTKVNDRLLRVAGDPEAARQTRVRNLDEKLGKWMLAEISF